MMKQPNRNALSFWPERETKLEAAHLLDLCEIAWRDKERLVTPFLSPALAAWFRTVLKDTGLGFLAWGGFEDAERVRFVLDGQGEDPGVAAAEVALVMARPHRQETILGHRDLLGSLLGLGLEREVIGDIRQGEKGAIVAVTKQIEAYIRQNWQSVGREKIETGSAESCQVLPRAGLEKRIVTSSARLDGLAAAGFGLSRSQVQELIRQGKVKRNDLECLKPETELKAGDVLACRGKGKLKILAAATKTKKDKNAWKILIYQDV
jgi:RNA-binding protein YlmH